MSKLPQGRGPRYGRDAFTDQNESWAQRLASQPQQDGLWVSPVGNVLASTSFSYPSSVRLWLIPPSWKTTTVTKVILRAATFAAPYTISVALYEYLEAERKFIQLTGTAATLSVTSAARFTAALPAPVTLEANRTLFLGMYSAATADLAALSSASSGVICGRSPTGATSLPLSFLLNSSTTLGTPPPAIYYLSQTAVDLLT